MAGFLSSALDALATTAVAADDLIVVYDTSESKLHKVTADLLINKPRLGGTASSATPTPAADAADIYTLTALVEAAAFATPSGTPVHGQRLTIAIYSAAARALDFTTATSYVPVGVVLPTTTVAGKWTYLFCIYNSTATKWHVLGVSQEA
jgi:hypothetical protein